LFRFHRALDDEPPRRDACDGDVCFEGMTAGRQRGARHDVELHATADREVESFRQRRQARVQRDR